MSILSLDSLKRRAGAKEFPVKINEVYRHFKSNQYDPALYKISWVFEECPIDAVEGFRFSIGDFLEVTASSDLIAGQPAVIYQSFTTKRYHARSLRNFLERISRPRFELVE